MRLSIFAYHISSIMLAKKGDRFTLYYKEGVEGVEVNVTHEVYDDFLVNGECVGNRHGAIAEYSKIVGNHYQLTKQRI